MAKRRDYSAEYQARQARAREEGYASDYERRMAGAPKGDDLGASEEREWARGHRGIGYLRDYAREGDQVEVASDRDREGRFTSLTYYPTDPHREVRTISIRDLSTDELHDLFDDLDDQGISVSAGYLEEEG
jgi:hypothetical protein